MMAPDSRQLPQSGTDATPCSSPSSEQWQLDVDESSLIVLPDSSAPANSAAPAATAPNADTTAPNANTTPAPPPSQSVPVAPPASAAQHKFVIAAPTATATTEASPPLEHILEAMLFVGGPPLTVADATRAIRGLSAEMFHQAIDALNRRYRRQNRPYLIVERDDGYVLSLLPQYRHLRQQLYGGPRTVRLTQAALEVLAIVAYRQPVSKSEVDALRGQDSAGPLRQLLHLGLITVFQRGEQRGTEPINPSAPSSSKAPSATSGQLENTDTDNNEPTSEPPLDTPQATRYGTTARFLRFFGLTSLDDLPHWATDPAAVTPPTTWTQAASARTTSL